MKIEIKNDEEDEEKKEKRKKEGERRKEIEDFKLCVWGLEKENKVIEVWREVEEDRSYGG